MMRNLIYIVLVASLFTACTNEQPDDTNTSDIPLAQGGEQVDEQYKLGKELFNKNCSSCHALNKDIIAPALAGIGQRRDKQWLYSFIRNNNEFRKSGDEDAIAIYKEYSGLAMPIYVDLTDKQIDAIIHYCDTPKG